MQQDEHWQEIFSAIQEEEWDDAIKSIDGLILREPSDPGHFEKLGDFHSNSRNPGAALAAFSTALQLYKKGHALAQAIVVCNKMLALDPAQQEVAEELRTLLQSHDNPDRVSVRLDALRAPRKELGASGVAEKLRTLAASGTAPELLRLLTEETLPESDNNLQVLHFEAGDTVVREGETGDSIFIITGGWVEVSVLIQGRRISLSTLTEGDIFGEMAFLTSRPRTATVTAITGLELCEVRKPLLDRIMEPRPQLLRYLYNVYISRMEATLAEIKNSAGGCLTGSLKELPLAEVLQVLELTRKEGRLVISAGDIQGVVSLSPGMVEDARCNQKKGDEAMMAMLALHEGSFSFEPGSVGRGEKAQPVRQVLLEAVRRMDERAAGRG